MRQHSAALQILAPVTSGVRKRPYAAFMLQKAGFDTTYLPHSAYAAELQRTDSNLRFSAELEAEYLRTQLAHDRLLIRTASVAALLLLLLYGVEQLLSHYWNHMVPGQYGLVLAGSCALAWIAWSPGFTRLYLRWAQIIIPIRSLILTAHIVEAAAAGRLELLLLLSGMVMSPFFFLGLRARTALLTAAVTIISFIAAALFYGMALPFVARSTAFLLTGAVTCAIAARQLERRSRRGFLEGNLLAQLAHQDSLTGTSNRRVFDEHLGRLWQQAQRDHKTMAILLIDIDHFKAYNDRYGHLAGDQALRRVAQSLQSFVRRPLDVLARYGGEEFGAILYDIEAAQAEDVAGRICRAVRELKIEHLDSRTCAALTISVGVALIVPTRERSARGALQLADQALYGAKKMGRNRVEVMTEAEHALLTTGIFSINPAALCR
jgi:diguanylate cyclase (GGDEF)-like protein